MQNNIDNKEKQKAFIHSLDFMRLGQAINRGQWQSAAMIIQRMDRVAKDAGINDFERQFTGIRQCINRHKQTCENDGTIERTVGNEYDSEKSIWVSI